ncbi:ArsR/SmtB family transcription factor [Paracoccus tegillarcae]|uniref:Transcriptional regulator n=1 Tax=Paracoccus tegillarcae TaxID=1529068 RepID=A0A2K9F5K0_9RHOB|nr:metalloregulator ArsR/SmtB family transcription factor [Paracoccus tegillarcae]AUH34461.1 transcriptional regulator [Paracoccus tegillarcae]
MNQNLPFTADVCPARLDVAERLSGILDADFFRALCEPVRLQLIVQLVRVGCSDVTGLADVMPQDRSVISRHLQVLERAGIVSSHQHGRQVFYQLESQKTVAQFEAIVTEMRGMAASDCSDNPN